MVRRVSFKGRHSTGKSGMKKAVIAMIMGVTLLTFSACGQTENEEDQTNIMSSTAEEDQTNIMSSTAEEDHTTIMSSTAEEDQTIITGNTAQAGGNVGENQETNKDEIADSADTDLTEPESMTGEYEGVYSDYDVNEPSLQIKQNNDGTCQIQIELFRLWSFEDGVGKITEEGLEFTATGPGGNMVDGIIKLDEEIASVTIFGQEWLDFAGLSEYKFYKTSDVPDIS